MAKLMNSQDFQAKLRAKSLILFTPLDIRRIFGVSKISVTFLLHRYAKKGIVVRLKRGLYSLAEIKVPDFYLANKLYEPSYISLEFALSYHRVIPENVYQITSVTTKATRRFEAQGKQFIYRRMKKDAFTGYATVQQRSASFLIADPEKSFVDANYFRLLERRKPLSRFDKEKINRTKALRYSKLFKNERLNAIIATTLQ